MCVLVRVWLGWCHPAVVAAVFSLLCTGALEKGSTCSPNFQLRPAFHFHFVLSYLVFVPNANSACCRHRALQRVAPPQEQRRHPDSRNRRRFRHPADEGPPIRILFRALQHGPVIRAAGMVHTTQVLRNNAEMSETSLGQAFKQATNRRLTPAKNISRCHKDSFGQ